MPKALVVVTPFGAYRRGDQITDTGKMAEINAGENAGHVVLVQLPDQPAAKES